jgi:AraC-like DNA-binding protein
VLSGADSLGEPGTGIDTAQAASAPAAVAVTPPSAALDSPAAAARGALRSGRTDTMNRRDSLLANVLHAIEREDSAVRNAAAVERETAEKTGERSVAGRAALLTGRLMRFKWVILGVAVVCAAIAVFLILLSRAAGKKDEKRFMTTTRLSLMNGEIQRACLYIEKQFHNPSLSPASVSAGIVTGEPFLEALFERELGMGIAAYIEQVRIHRAKLVIAWNPAADARFVASQVGFSQEAEFEQSFQRTVGVDFESFRREKTAAVR